MNSSTAPPKTGMPSPTRRSPAGPSRHIPGGPMASPEGLIKRQAHRRKVVGHHLPSLNRTFVDEQ